MECSGTIAAKGIAKCDGISVACVVGVAIPCVGLAIADSGIFGGAYFGLVDGEVEGYDAIATIGSGRGVSICASLGVCLTIPSVRVASGDSLLGADGWVNRQVKDMLDAIDVCASVFLNMGVCTCSVVVLVIPLIRQLGVADSDGLLVGCACGEDREVEDVDNAIAGSSQVLLYIGV